MYMKKYSVHRGVVQPQTLELIKYALLMQKDTMYYNSGVDKSDRSRFADGKPVDANCCGFGVSYASESLLRILTPFVMEQLGEPLYPTFSFARIYWKDAVMFPHTDRPSCEVSVSVSISVNPKPWTIYMDGEGIDLMPGDLVLYEGMEVEHWREPYEGEEQIQVFCHWVRANGKHEDLLLDGRPFLGYDPINSRPSNTTFPWQR